MIIWQLRHNAGQLEHLLATPPGQVVYCGEGFQTIGGVMFRKMSVACHDGTAAGNQYNSEVFLTMVAM